MRTRVQRHFQAHNDEVRCLAQHPVNLNLIASGQTAAIARDENGSPPHIAVWDSTDFNKSWVLRLTPQDRSIPLSGVQRLGQVPGIRIERCESHHQAVGLGDAHTVGLGRAVTATPSSRCAGNPKDPSEFVTVGKQHAVFWRFDGSKLTARKAHIPSAQAITFYSVAFSEKGYACLGSEHGSIYVFVDGRLVREFKKIHSGKVFALEWFPGGLISGGGDGVVNILDKKLDIVRNFTFHHRINLALRARQSSARGYAGRADL